MKCFLFREVAAAILLAILLFGNEAHAQMPSVSAGLISPTRNYELSLGASVTPSMMVTNLDSTPVSGMKWYFRIQNIITGFITYFDSVTLPTLPGKNSIELRFAPYATSIDSLRQLGTFDACLMGQDTECSLLFGLRRTALPFLEPSDNYSTTVPGLLAPASIEIADQVLWASLGATVVDGENVTWDPPPPRYPIGGVGPDKMIGPVMRLDRMDYSGNFYTGNGVGDTLTSFPINLEGKQSIILSFDYLRAGRRRYPLGWDSDTLFGPEGTVLNAQNNSVIRAGDSLVLEFLDPSQPSTNPAPNGWNEIAAIDGGRDFEFKTLYAQGDSNSWTVSINGETRTISRTPNYLTSDFRFRLRLKAKNDRFNLDDADQWYVDNLRVDHPMEPSVEVNWVRVVNAYNEVPKSQAVFPVFVHAVAYRVAGQPWGPFTVQIVDPKGATVYSQSITPTFGNTVDTVLAFPNWDASTETGTDTGSFTAIASVSVNASVPSELDTAFTKFYLSSRPDDGIQDFALEDGHNDIPVITGASGSGIGFNSTSNGSFAMKFQLVQPDTFYGVRAYFGSANSAPDPIRISLLSGNGSSNVPGGTLSTLDARRGPNFDAFNTYPFQIPVFLTPGTYWVSVSQLSIANMELGGSTSRGGCVMVRSDPFQVSPTIRPVYGPSSPGAPWYGTQWGSGPDDNNGDVSTSWAVEANAGSGGWAPVLPASGWSPEMSQSGIPFSEILQPELSVSSQLNGLGVYAPMIRPLFSRPPASIVHATNAPASLTLEPTIPNPFAPSASPSSIAFTVAAQSPTSLVICDGLGRVLKTLVDANLPAGSHFASWDGKDESGAIVPGGIYFVLLSSAGQHAEEKVIVVE